MSVDEKKMSFLDHLSELRVRVIKILLLIGAGFGISYVFSDKILRWLKKPLPQDLVFINPAEAFLVNLKVSFFSGIIITLPFILFQLWKFITPGLKKNEKGYAFSFIVFGSLLFFMGALFAYYLVLPLGIHFLLSYGFSGLQPMISVESYISFCTMILLTFGMVFNLPVFVVIFTRLRIVNADILVRNRKFAVLIIFVLAAVLTPPDVFTQILLGIPLVLLYELSIWLSRLFKIS